MKKIIGMTGTHDRYGTVTLTYNSQEGYWVEGQLGDKDAKKLLPCHTCESVYEVRGNVVAFNCDECVAHLNACDDPDCKFAIHKRGNGSPPYDAATATGCYDRD